MDKTNKTFAEFAVKNGWKKTEAGKDGDIYVNIGCLRGRRTAEQIKAIIENLL